MSKLENVRERKHRPLYERIDDYTCWEIDNPEQPDNGLRTIVPVGVTDDLSHLEFPAKVAEVFVEHHVRGSGGINIETMYVSVKTPSGSLHRYKVHVNCTVECDVREMTDEELAKE